MKPTPVNSFACLDCKKIFKLRIELKKHTERKHENFPLIKYSLDARSSHLIKSHNSQTVRGALVKSHIGPEKSTTHSVKAQRKARGKSDAVKQHRRQNKLCCDRKKPSSSENEKPFIWETRKTHEKFTPLKEFSQLRHWLCECTRCPLKFLSFADFVSHFSSEHVEKSMDQNGIKMNGLSPSEDDVRDGIKEQVGRTTVVIDKKDGSKTVTGQFDIRRDVITARPFLYEPSNGHVQSTGSKSNSSKKSDKLRKAREKRRLQLYCKHLTRRPFILHKCVNCNKSFTFYKHLREHERGHAPRNHHNCCYCSRRLASSLSYYRHIKTAHKEELQNHDKSKSNGEKTIESGTNDLEATKRLSTDFLDNSQALRSRITCAVEAEGITLGSASAIHCGSDVHAENIVMDLSLSSIIWKYYATCSHLQGVAVETEPKVTREMASQAYACEGGRFRNDTGSTTILEMETTKLRVGCENPTSHIKSNDKSGNKHRDVVKENAKSPPCPLFGTSDQNTSNRKSLPEDSKFINLENESKLSKTWQCSQCPLRFDDYSVFMQHVETHEGHIQQCSYCPRKFTQTAGLLSHIKAKHLNTPGYYNKSRMEDDSNWNDVKTLDVIRGQCTNVDQSQLGLPSDTIVHCLLCNLRIRGLETAKIHIQLVHNDSILRRLLQNTW